MWPDSLLLKVFNVASTTGLFLDRLVENNFGRHELFSKLKSQFHVFGHKSNPTE